jgi:hypothetical protein
MRAVWSFWSKPFYAQKGRAWLEPLHHWLAWGLSLRLARRHYPDTMLVTDSPGKALLLDSLGLSFTRVSTALDSIRAADAGWWSLGKLVAYSLQDQPFLHLDTDVFLWKPLPASMLNAPVFAQCPENYHSIDQWCGPRTIEELFARHRLGLPAEWEWSRSRWGRNFCEANCGIAGGMRADFLRHYAKLAIDLVLNPEYAPAWQEIRDKDGFNQIIEQFLLAACVEFHRSHPTSSYRGISIRYLFPSIEEAFDPDHAARAGFTHLLGDANRDAFVARRLEQRMQYEDAAYYQHCLQLIRNRNLLPSVGA